MPKYLLKKLIKGLMVKPYSSGEFGVTCVVVYEG